MTEERETLKNDVPMAVPDPTHMIPKLMSLKLGESVIYHVGNLADDRSRKSENHADLLTSRINQNAKIAMQLSDDRKVHLTQRKLYSKNGLPYYEYIATGAHP